MQFRAGWKYVIREEERQFYEGTLGFYEEPFVFVEKIGLVVVSRFIDARGNSFVFFNAELELYVNPFEVNTWPNS